MELFTYEGAWSLPSLDPGCLAVEAYLQAADVPMAKVCIRDVNDPTRFPFGTLPVLKDGPELFHDIPAILAHLQRQGYDLDRQRTPAEKFKIAAVSSLAESDLLDALIYTLWCLEKNRIKMAKLYAGMLPFQARLSMVYNDGMMEWVQRRLAGKYPRKHRNAKQASTESTESLAGTTFDPLEHSVYQHVRKVYTALSTVLREKKYFFGDEVSSLDCIVFGHLALHFYAELPVQPLRSILEEEFPSLVQFVQRFREDYFSTTRIPFSQSIWIRKQKEPRLTSFSQFQQSWSSLMEYVHQQSYQWMAQIFHWNRSTTPLLTNATEEDADTNPITKRTKEKIRESRTLSIVGGVCAFVFYIWYRGIISIQIGEDDNENVVQGVRHGGQDEDEDEEEGQQQDENEREEVQGSLASRAMKTEEEEEEEKE